MAHARPIRTLAVHNSNCNNDPEDEFMNVDKEFDATGLSCPMPIAKLVQQIRTMETGEVLKLVADDPGSMEDVPAWCRRTGNELLETTEESDTLVFHIRKK